MRSLRLKKFKAMRTLKAGFENIQIIWFPRQKTSTVAVEVIFKIQSKFTVKFWTIYSGLKFEKCS